MTHFPHGSWCEVCIKARGREDAHASQKEKGAKPTIAMDCKDFGEAEDSEDKIKRIIFMDEESGCMAAHVVEQKGSADQWAVQCILDDIRMFGHTDIIMKCEDEPALVQVQREIVDKGSAGSVHQNPPHMTHRLTARLSEASRSSRTRCVLEHRIQMKIDTSWQILEWMVELAPTLINRCLIGHDSK